MKFLLDANLSPAVAAALNDAGYESSHVADVGLLRASDDEILEFAAETVTSWSPRTLTSR